MAATPPLMIYRMPARFRGRTNNSDSSGCGMEEDSSDLGLHLVLCPIGMLVAQPGGLKLAGGPIKLLSERKTPLWAHLAEDFDLLFTGLFVGQHARNPVNESTQQAPGLSQSFLQFGNVLAAPTRIIGSAAAFAANNRRNRLNNFS